MMSKIVSKKDTQLMIKALREANLKVSKINNGYECFNKKNVLLFKAIKGKNNYLVRMKDNLFN